MLIGFGFSWPRALERTPRLSAPPATAETLMKFLRVVNVMRTETMIGVFAQRNWRGVRLRVVRLSVANRLPPGRRNNRQHSARLEVEWNPCAPFRSSLEV